MGDDEWRIELDRERGVGAGCVSLRIRHRHAIRACVGGLNVRQGQRGIRAIQHGGVGVEIPLIPHRRVAAGRHAEHSITPLTNGDVRGLDREGRREIQNR